MSNPSNLRAQVQAGVMAELQSSRSKDGSRTSESFTPKSDSSSDDQSIKVAPATSGALEHLANREIESAAIGLQSLDKLRPSDLASATGSDSEAIANSNTQQTVAERVVQRLGGAKSLAEQAGMAWDEDARKVFEDLGLL